MSVLSTGRAGVKREDAPHGGGDSRFVTCGFCGARLAVKHESDAYFTEVLVREEPAAPADVARGRGAYQAKRTPLVHCLAEIPGEDIV